MSKATKKAHFHLKADGRLYLVSKYDHMGGSELIIFRGPVASKRIDYTRKVAGKLVYDENGFPRGLERDKLWADESPDAWIPWQTLHEWLQAYYNKRGGPL